MSEPVEVGGFICSTPVYQYNGWTFEFEYIGGPWPLRKDGEARKRIPDAFWDDIAGFLELSEKKRNKHRIRGGCQRF